MVGCDETQFETSRPCGGKRGLITDVRSDVNALVHNVGACAVAGIGRLKNVAKRNVKPDQLRPVPRHNLNKETESSEDTEPGHCTSTVLWPVPFTLLFSMVFFNFYFVEF